MSLLKTFFKKLASVKKRANTVGIDFNELTKEAVAIVWNPEIGDISTINKCLDVSRSVKGFNSQALLTFFKMCVPFTYNKDQEFFTKKNGQTADKMLSTWESFIESNNWYDYIPDKAEKAYTFKPESIINQVAKKLEEADEHNVLTLSNLLSLQTELNKVIESHLAFETDMAEVDTELATLLQQTVEPLPLAAVG